MRVQYLVFLVAFLTINCYSQISFDNGYFIDSTNQKINCQIKNLDWKNNPTEFEYRLSETSEIKKADVKLIKELVIDNSLKYITATVEIDRSSDIIDNMSYVKDPIFSKEKLFLRVLFEGKSNLYEYVEDNLTRYFYTYENLNIQQLIFKSYINNNKIAKNNSFKHQLWNNLKCANFNMSKFENINYNKNELIKLFKEHSKCNNYDLVYYEIKKKKDLFNLTIRPRINNSSLTIQNLATSMRDTDFGNKFGLGFGIEAEMILPYNNNKWSIVVEPTYQSFKTTNTANVANIIGGLLIANVDYSSIEVPIGLRHYFFLNNTDKVFVNVSNIFDFGLNSSIKFNRKDGLLLNTFDIELSMNQALGIGYKYNDKFSLEFRYQTNRAILGQYKTWKSKYNTMSLILGYSLF